jgi:hypothetical protein
MDRRIEGVRLRASEALTRALLLRHPPCPGNSRSRPAESTSYRRVAAKNSLLRSLAARWGVARRPTQRHLRVVSGGVEPEVQLEFLVGSGRDELQGFLLGRRVVYPGSPLDDILYL